MQNLQNLIQNFIKIAKNISKYLNIFLNLQELKQTFIKIAKKCSKYLNML